MKHILLLLSVFITSLTCQAQVSQTKYDYSNVAAQAVGNATTDYDKAKAIYRYLCRHIAYDTSYSILLLSGKTFLGE